MGIRGRKSAGDITAVSAALPNVPPPKTLSKEAAVIWREVMVNKPAVWFEVLNPHLLSDYCNIRVDEARLTKLCEQKFRQLNRHPDNDKDYRDTLRLRNRCSKRCASLATKLRLTATVVPDQAMKRRSKSKSQIMKRPMGSYVGKINVKAAKLKSVVVSKDIGDPWIYTGPLKNPSLGQRVIWFIENHCRIPEGQYVGQPVKLRDWQKKIILETYDDPTRRAIVSFGRKNAKTTLAALLLLAHLIGPCYKENSSLYSDAQSREQAAILFTLAAKCVRLSPTLSAYVVVRDTVKQLACPSKGTLYRALSAEVATSFGLSSPFVVHDELGQVRGPRSDLYEAIESAMGAYESPLSIVISTQAPNDNDLLSLLIDDAKTGKDPKTKLFLFTASPDMDPFSEEAWKAANPAYGDFLSADEVRQQAEIAERMPSREASFRNLILNQRVEAYNPFVSKSVWMENAAKPLMTKKQKVYGALDLATVNDLCALELVSEDGDVHSTFWLPEEGLKEKARADKFEYDVWKDQGYLLTTPGRSVEYEYIAEYMRGVFDYYDVQAIAFDRYNMKFLTPWLKKAGFTDKELERFVEFGQGFVSMSPAIRELESRLLMKKLKHGDHPILTWCASNAIIVSDPAGNRKFDKSKTSGRIDGMVALAMAIGVMPIQIGSAPKKYQLFFV